MSRTILIVDDSKPERIVLAGFLKADYDILEASCAQDALELLRRHYKNVSAIVMNIIMPGMDGFELLTVIKSNPQWLSIPVVVTTALDDEDAREKAIACGADSFITKPFSPKILHHMVSNAIKLRETAAIANTLWRDSLTGLLSRDSFFSEAGRMLRRYDDGFFMLSCFDIENFKVVNDQYGTAVGDEVLRHIAACLSSFAAENNGLVCRYMADKFAVLFPAQLKDSEQIKQYHEKLISPACLSRPIRIRIGRYTVTDRTLPVSAMFDRASMAEASVKGRFDVFRVEYTEQMRLNLLHEQQIVNDMTAALSAGEFEPWFQPQYNHATGAMIGSEALVRWRKDGRIIPPDSFIPIFERNGFIYEVDQYIWRQVCVLQRRWLDDGKEPLPVSVNISRYDMFQKDFLDIICGLVKEYSLPTDLLRLEITESAFGDSSNTIISMVNRLIERGFTVEIDDFGSGYSSLNTLKDVPASILKLDMRFFENTANSQRGGNIVESVVRMAKWLGMAVIAEGVEDKNQADYLKSIGCYYIQGYYYAKPMPVAEYEKNLEQSAKEPKLSRLETLSSLNNNEFWDPKSMDTLIFNSYVGAACILEYSTGIIEMLRATDYYVRTLGSSELGIEEVLRLNWASFMDAENLRLFTKAVSDSLETKEVVYGEYEFRELPGCPKITVLRVGVRVIASVGDHHLIYCLSENITAQKKAEREALDASERVNAVMANSHSGITAIILHEDGHVEQLFINNRLFEMLGYTRAQFEAEVNDPFGCLLPGEREAIVKKAMALKGVGSSITLRMRARRRDGSLIWLRCDISIVKFANVSSPVQLSSFLDITEQVENETKQLESARKLEIIMGNVNGGVSAIRINDDGSSEHLFTNERYYELYGYTRRQAEMQKLDVMTLILPEDLGSVMEKVRKLKRDRQPALIDYRIVKPDGKLAMLRANASLMALSDSDDVITAVVTDITEKKALEEKLSAIIANINGGISAIYLKDGRAEFVISNDQYYSITGYTKAQFDTEVKSVFDLILPEDRQRVLNEVKTSRRESGRYTMEYRIRRRDGKIRDILCSTSIIRLFGIDAPVQLAVSNDITELRTTQRAERAVTDKLHEVMKETNRQLRFLNDSAHDILVQPDSERAIGATLGKLTDYFAADRGYVVELDVERGVSDNTYEVCAPGIAPQKDRLQGLPYGPSDFWYDTLSRDKFMSISNVSALDESRAGLRAMLLEQGIHSLILAPLWKDGQLRGFVGVDNPARAALQIKQLTALADYISILLSRRDMMLQIRRDSETVRQLVNDTPGGFLRMAVHGDKHPTIVSFNEGFCSMLRMTRGDLTAAYGSDALKCLVEEDIPAAIADTAQAYAECGQHSGSCRLRRSDGSVVHTMFFGRFIKDERGKMFLNAYFTDMTGVLAAEQQQKQLLDNLPCGAALYEYDGKKISVIHINQRYWQLVHRNPVDYSQASVLDVVLKDDLPMLQQEIDAALRQKRDIEVDVRILCGDESYQPFHIDARVLPGKDGKKLFFVSYRPISTQTMSVQEMLPIALSTMMSASEDYSYVKDLDQRYICCSQSVAQLLGLESTRDIIGKTDYDIFDRDTAAGFAARSRRIFDTEKALTGFEETLPAKDGRQLTVSTSMYPLLDASGRTVGMYGISHDITVQKQKESQLELLTGTIPGGLAAYSVSGGSLKILYFNEGYYAFSGYTREEYVAMTSKDPLALLIEEDRPKMLTLIRGFIAQKTDGISGSCTYRCRTKYGAMKWMSLKAVLSVRGEDSCTLNVVQLDVTDQQEEKERLRLAEEEYRIATRHSGHTIGRYDIAARTLTITEDASVKLALPECIPDVPYGRVKLGKISAATADDYIAFYEKIRRGEKECTVTFQKLLSAGWRWITERATTIFDENGKPVSAIISYSDVTEQQEKEAVYKKWQQNLRQKGPESYTLYRCNLNQNSTYDSVEGLLLNFHEGWDASMSFNERTREFAEQCVCEEDRRKYIEFVNSDTMLASYYRGRRSAELEFRGTVASGELRWMRLCVELVEYPNTKDISAYLMYEDINDSKLQAIQTKTMAETDPLTGLLNRKTFTRLMEARLAESQSLSALFLIDVDGFKQVNDSFGHAVGDQVLIDTGRAIFSVVRERDLVCRMGGDEFLVWLCDMPDRESILGKARQICGLMHNISDSEVKISVSLGVALCPEDGSSFEQLYHNVDKALYHVKGHGKNSCAFYDASMQGATMDVSGHVLSPIEP